MQIMGEECISIHRLTCLSPHVLAPRENRWVSPETNHDTFRDWNGNPTTTLNRSLNHFIIMIISHITPRQIMLKMEINFQGRIFISKETNSRTAIQATMSATSSAFSIWRMLIWAFKCTRGSLDRHQKSSCLCLSTIAGAFRKKDEKIVECGPAIHQKWEYPR